METTVGRRRGRKALGEKTTMVNFKAPVDLAAAIRKAAIANYESDAAYCRRVIVERLRVEGVLPKL